MIGQCPQHGGKLVDVGPAAAQLVRHPGFHQARRFEQGEVVGDISVLVAGFTRPLGENRTELARDFDRAGRR
jgi:hypothetical protein